MLFLVGRVTYISCSMVWEVSLVGRNTITHGGSVGPATQEVNVQLIESTGVSNCSVQFGYRHRTGSGCSDVQLCCCCSVVVVQARRRCCSSSALLPRTSWT